jgi:hypothetical protein
MRWILEDGEMLLMVMSPRILYIKNNYTFSRLCLPSLPSSRGGVGLEYGAVAPPSGSDPCSLLAEFSVGTNQWIQWVKRPCRDPHSNFPSFIFCYFML